jgi:predicted extracellular nuclease
MKIIITSILLFFCFNLTFSQDKTEEIYVASWNLENLFDNVDDDEKNDSEWLEDGSKQWTDDKIKNKLLNLSKVIRYMNVMEGPDILGVQEVEHQHLLDSILIKYFCDKNYQISYAETPDRRGIDNGVIYNADKFKLLATIPHEVKLDSGYPTRYVFQSTLQHIISGKNFYVFVNHWPSRRGGEEKSRPNRVRAAETLVDALTKVYEENNDPNIFIMGDFNDEPNNVSILNTLNAAEFYCDSSLIYSDKNLYNLSTDEFSRGWGTYLFRGDWNMLDQIIVSKNLIVDSDLDYVCNSFEIVKPYFMVTATGPYKGSARPTWGGRTYLGGYSDHFPVAARFILEIE